MNKNDFGNPLSRHIPHLGIVAGQKLNLNIIKRTDLPEEYLINSHVFDRAKLWPSATWPFDDPESNDEFSTDRPMVHL
jgi:hypothetical protein